MINCQFSWISSSTLCLFKSWLALTGLSDHSWLPHHCLLLFSPSDTQYSCSQYLHHKKPITYSEFWWEFNFRASKTSCYQMLFSAVENQSSIFNQIQCKRLSSLSLPYGKLKLKEQQTSGDNFHFRVTPHVREDFTETLLSKHPLCIK